VVATRETRAQRAADALTRFSGSWAFVIGCAASMVGWLALNWWLGERAPDPSPFLLYNLTLTVVSTLQGPVIMLSQVRQDERDRASVAELNAKLDRLLAHIETGGVL